MKLRDFSKKRNLSKPPRNQKIVLNNDAADARHKAEINELNSRLSNYQNIQKERDEAVHRLHAIEDILKSERASFEQSAETIQTLQLEISNLTDSIEKIPQLEEDLRTAKGVKAITQSELDAMTKRAMEQSKELSFIKPQLENLKKELEKTTKETKEAMSLKQSTDVDFEQVSNKNKELKSFADETSKINKELIEENKSLRDWANYKDVENKGLINQLEELQSVEINLQELMSKMELRDSETTSSNTSLTTKVSTQQKVITDMGKTLEDMKKELVYLVRLNNEYKKELARPTYTSMAAIASQEGFVMPNGKENTRTHNLGNYKPTLIKFKKKEAANGG